MALDPIHQRCLPQMPPPPLRKRKLNVILPDAVAPDNFLAQSFDVRWYVHALECSIVTYTLEEGNAVAGTTAPSGA